MSEPEGGFTSATLRLQGPLFKPRMMLLKFLELLIGQAQRRRFNKCVCVCVCDREQSLLRQLIIPLHTRSTPPPSTQLGFNLCVINECQRKLQLCWKKRKTLSVQRTKEFRVALWQKRKRKVSYCTTWIQVMPDSPGMSAGWVLLGPQSVLISFGRWSKPLCAFLMNEMVLLLTLRGGIASHIGSSTKENIYFQMELLCSKVISFSSTRKAHKNTFITNIFLS